MKKQAKTKPVTKLAKPKTRSSHGDPLPVPRNPRK